MRAAWGIMGMMLGLTGCAHSPQAQLQDGLLSTQGMRPAMRALLKEADVAPTEVKPSKIAGHWEVNAGSRRYLVNEAGSTLTVFSLSGSPATLSLEKILFVTPGEAPVTVLPSSTSQPPVVVRSAKPAPVAAQESGAPTSRVGFNAAGAALSPEDTAAQVKAIYAGLPDAFTINYLVDNPKRTIVVFSDYSCTYCQRLHEDIQELNAAGISVRYLLFPRVGVDLRNAAVQSEFEVMRNIWCASDQRAAAELAYHHELPPTVSCDQPYNKTRSDFPVLAHHALGRVFNVQGTPYIFSDDGRTQEGYADADQLLSWLGMK